MLNCCQSSKQLNLSQNIEFTSNFRALASDIGLTSAGLAISWCLAKGNHILPIPGTRNIVHFKEMVAGSEHILTSTELKEVENVLPIGWVDGDRYSEAQWKGPERYS